MSEIQMKRNSAVDGQYSTVMMLTDLYQIWCGGTSYQRYRACEIWFRKITKRILNNGLYNISMNYHAGL